MRTWLVFVMLAGALAMPAPAQAEEPVLTLSLGSQPQRLTASRLLARPDAVTLQVPDDVAYGRPMTYRAVPLSALLESLDPAFDSLEVQAIDGFVAQLPLSLVNGGASGGSVPWIAVEDPTKPWAPLPGKTVSAGPFYLVWEHPKLSGVGPEHWPFQIAAITATRSPARRWPQMAVDEGLPEDAPERRGEAVFVALCIPCHRMKGAGASDIGPDLGAPISPTLYLTPDGLRALIRNPRAVRTWPQQAMPGFDAQVLPDVDLEALITYLAHMAEPLR